VTNREIEHRQLQLNHRPGRPGGTTAALIRGIGPAIATSRPLPWPSKKQGRDLLGRRLGAAATRTAATGTGAQGMADWQAPVWG